MSGAAVKGPSAARYDPSAASHVTPAPRPIPKAKQALKRYGHQIVVANDLNTRKQEVVFVSPDSEEWLRIDDEQLRSGYEIEEDIIAKLVQMHTEHIQRPANGVSQA